MARVALVTLPRGRNVTVRAVSRAWIEVAVAVATERISAGHEVAGGDEPAVPGRPRARCAVPGR
jgi:hypothetical protein